MKQTLQLKVGQSLTMSPQLQQAIRLLQLSTLELQNEIQEALDSNPMLEEVEDRDDRSEEPLAEDRVLQKEGTDTSDDLEHDLQTNDSDSDKTDSEWSQDIPSDLSIDTSWDDVYQPETTPSITNHNDSDSNYLESNSSSETLHDHLRWQLNLTPFSDQDRFIALSLIDAILPCGMLSMSIEDIYDGLKEDIAELSIDEVSAVLRRLQQFDPVGIGYRNLSECLAIQLNQLPDDTPHLAMAKRVVEDYIDCLGNRDYRALMRRLRVKETELSHVIELIKTLNPRPGEEIGSDDTEYVVPDVFVSKKEDRWMVKLNSTTTPKLSINNNYASLVKRADSSRDNTYLKDNLQEARWFLKSLQSRNETLLKVASCIVEKQNAFFDHGEEAMLPLVLNDVAKLVDMHESTISRATSKKYMHTPKGIFEFKYFFSSHVTTSSGSENSSTAICSMIKKMIAGENRKKPLSDNKIAAELIEQGIQVARRTVAKYRESMAIPPSNERKQLL